MFISSAMLIQDAIREFHGAIAMPVMAPIVVDRPSTSDAVERYESKTKARLTGFERNVLSFVAASRRLADQMRDAARQPAGVADLSDLTDFVHHLERMAERLAMDDARTEKDMLREARSREKRDVGLAAAHRRATARLALLNARVVEALLALALEVRALRSTLIVPRVSPVFEDSNDLARYLDDALRS